MIPDSSAQQSLFYENTKQDSKVYPPDAAKAVFFWFLLLWEVSARLRVHRFLYLRRELIPEYAAPGSPLLTNPSLITYLGS